MDNFHLTNKMQEAVFFPRKRRTYVSNNLQIIHKLSVHNGESVTKRTKNFALGEQAEFISLAILLRKHSHKICYSCEIIVIYL